MEKCKLCNYWHLKEVEHKCPPNILLKIKKKAEEKQKNLNKVQNSSFNDKI